MSEVGGGEWCASGRYIFAAGGRNGVWEEGAGKELMERVRVELVNW